MKSSEYSTTEWQAELEALRVAAVCCRSAQGMRSLTYALPMDEQYKRIITKLAERAQAHKVSGTVVVLDIHIEPLTEALKSQGFVVTNLGAGTLNETRAAFSSMLKISWDRNGS